MGQASPTYRILFSAVARFANGGELRMTDFMLDWPDDQPDRARLAREIVRDLGLLMVHDLEFDDVRIVRGTHKRGPSANLVRGKNTRRLIGSDEPGSVGVPVNRLFPAAVVDVAGHEPAEVSALTLYGAWDGEPVLVVSGLGEVRVAASALEELHQDGLRWVVADAPVGAAVVPVTVAPAFIASATADLLEVGVVVGESGRQQLVGVTAAPTPRDVRTYEHVW